jgi:hypothetical protein
MPTLPFLAFLLLAPLPPHPVEAAQTKRDLITRAEIEKSAKVNDDIYQLVRSMRPHFLAPPRGVRSFGAGATREVVLYINGNKQAELAVMRTIKARDVEEVRYLDPTRAEEAYGITHNGGALLVTLVGGRKP